MPGPDRRFFLKRRCNFYAPLQRIFLCTNIKGRILPLLEVFFILRCLGLIADFSMKRCSFSAPFRLSINPPFPHPSTGFLKTARKEENSQDKWQA
jgi:hypothetical protein